MEIIDPHHHLWNLSRLDYPWLMETDKTTFFGDYSPLAKNYLPIDYLGDSAGFELIGSVHIQAEADPKAPLAETRWLNPLADEAQGIAIPTAIVAFADFTRDDIESTLAAHCEFHRVKGIRQILNFHKNPELSYTDKNLLEDDNWWKHFSLLEKYRLSFDMQLYYQQMELAAQLAEQHPNIQIILNHTGMPLERDTAGLNGWHKGMERLAGCPNVAVKISGLGMCDPKWTGNSIRPFVLDTIAYFGTERCMFASNFPVDSLFGSYTDLYRAYEAITVNFTPGQHQQLFCDNAKRFYQL